MPEFPSEIVADFVDLAAIEKGALENGRFSVMVNGSKFDCLFYRKPDHRLFVILHGARIPDKHPLPVFQRWSWHDMFPGSVMYVSDPTLNLDPENMQLGWYVGTETRNHLVDLSQLVRVVAGTLGLDTKQVITYGSSGGGFASLMLAACLGNATAVSINAQIRILEYMPRFVDRFLQVSFGGKKPCELTSEVHARLDAIDAVTNAPNMKCLYVQNIRDVQHYEKHFREFCNVTGAPIEGGHSANRMIQTLLFDDATGHGAEPKNLAPKLISIAVNLAEDDIHPGVAMGRSERLILGADGTNAELKDIGFLNLLGRIRSEIPDSVSENVTDKQVIALIREAFASIRHEIDSTIEGGVNVGGLGQFRVKQVQREKNGQMETLRRIMFHPPKMGTHNSAQ